LIEHVTQRQRELTKAGLPLDRVGPPLFPDYANFDLGTVEAFDGAECYAYPHNEGRVAAETGVNILRGVRRPDGADEAVSAQT
jgi:hypothetical protein